MTDPWCAPVMASNGNRVSGGAARNVRIAASGGMNRIIDSVAREAAESALQRANMSVRTANIKLA